MLIKENQKLCGIEEGDWKESVDTAERGLIEKDWQMKVGAAWKLELGGALHFPLPPWLDA